jgi:fatty acid desaturase
MQSAHTAPRPAELIHLRPDNRAGFATFIVAVGGTTLAVALSLRDGWAPWVAGQALLAVMLVQWFAILHECGHDTLFGARRHNLLAGRVAGFFAGIPFASWVRVHGRHHKWTGWQDLDPTTASLAPRARGRIERTIVNVCWRCWIPLFALLYRASNYWHLPRLLRMFPKRADRRAITSDVVVLLAVYGGIVTLAGPAVLLRAAGLGVLLSLVIQDLLILSQHTHIPQRISHGAAVRPFPALEQEPFTRSLRLPPLASRFVLHFDAHELHHMYPFVPGYHLRRIAYAPGNEIGWWHWVRGARRVRGEVLLFQNRVETGYDL